jgi:hypothetical protein
MGMLGTQTKEWEWDDHLLGNQSSTTKKGGSAQCNRSEERIGREIFGNHMIAPFFLFKSFYFCGGVVILVPISVGSSRH